MNKSLTNKFILMAIIGFMVACAPKRKPVQTPVETPKIVAPKVETPQGDLVPFTRELFFKLRDKGLDVKKLKVFIDKTIVLNKISTNDNMEIDPVTGTLIKKIGLADNTISITPTVAGMIESVEADGVRVNFGRNGSTLKFVNNSTSPVNFTFNPDKINKANNSNEVNYNGSVYKAGNEGFGGTGFPDAKLMIRQLDIEIGTGKGTVEPGIGGKGSLF